jgi:hypothetical protein
MKSARIVKLVFGLVGVLMLVGAGLLYQNTTKFIASASRARGEVIELLRVESSRRNSSDTWRPLVHFKLPSGEIVEFAPSSSSSPPAYDKGEIVGVFFNPGDPKDARLERLLRPLGRRDHRRRVGYRVPGVRHRHALPALRRSKRQAPTSTVGLS